MSTKTIVGNIPENITYIYSGKKKLESYWENDALRAGWEGQEVTPAFCSDSSNLKTMETGRRWARRAERYNEPDKQSFEYQHKNDPIVGLKIVSLEIRSEGGRAYKVLTPENYYFDVREDVLMDTMLEVGISAGGVLNGSFVWARVNSEMKLVRVGSKLHDALLVATADHKLKKLRYGDLEVGHIYAGKGKDQYIFLGYVDTFVCERDEQRHNLGWGVNSKYTYTRSSKFVKNGLLLCKICEYNKDREQVSIENLYNIDVKTSHSFIKDIGTVEVPADIISQVNEWSKKYIIKNAAEQAERYKLDRNNEENYRDAYFAYQSSTLFATPTGQEIQVPEMWKDLFKNYPRKEK